MTRLIRLAKKANVSHWELPEKIVEIGGPSFSKLVEACKGENDRIRGCIPFFKNLSKEDEWKLLTGIQEKLGKNRVTFEEACGLEEVSHGELDPSKLEECLKSAEL